MWKIRISSRFKKDTKKLFLDQKLEADFFWVINLLAKGEKLPVLYKDHALQGLFIGCRECHIRSDVLLVYQYVDEELLLLLIRIGSHNELFG